MTNICIIGVKSTIRIEKAKFYLNSSNVRLVIKERYLSAR